MKTRPETDFEKPLLLSAAETADTLKISRSTLYAHHDTGRVPAPVRIGRRIFWRAAEIQAWVDAGCPPRGQWESTAENN